MPDKINWAELSKKNNPPKQTGVDWQSLMSGGVPLENVEQPQLVDSQIEEPAYPDGAEDQAAVRESIGKAISNIPSSANQLGKDLWQAVTNPIDTANALGKAALGAGELLIPGEQGHEDNARAIGQFFADRYGGFDKAKETFETDPLGLLGDFAAFMSGGGAALRGGAKVAQVSRAPRVAAALDDVGSAALKVGDAADPINVGVKSLQAADRAAESVIRPVAGTVLGDISTGAGKGAVVRAMSGSDEFADAMRGRTSPEEVLAETKQALDEVRQKRSADYNASRAEVKANATQINTDPVKLSMNDALSKMKVRRGANGELKFGGSEVDKKGWADVQEVHDLVNEWGALDPSQLTPDGLYTLRRRLNDLRSESNNSRTLVDKVKKSIDDLIRRESPEYSSMMGDYASASDFITEAERALSLRDRASADTALRKLLSSTRQSGQSRGRILQELDEITNRNLSDKVAGINMSAYTPTGMVGRGLIASLLYGGAALSGVAIPSPSVVAMMMTASPRIVGETLHTLYGIPRKNATKIIESQPFRNARRASLALYESGKLTNNDEDVAP